MRKEGLRGMPREESAPNGVDSKKNAKPSLDSGSHAPGKRRPTGRGRVGEHKRLQKRMYIPFHYKEAPFTENHSRATQGPRAQQVLAPGRPRSPRGPRDPWGPLGLCLCDTKTSWFGSQITKNKKIHEMGRHGSVWRDTSADFLVRPSRTSWDRSPSLPGKQMSFWAPWV